MPRFAASDGGGSASGGESGGRSSSIELPARPGKAFSDEEMYESHEPPRDAFGGS